MNKPIKNNTKITKKNCDQIEKYFLNPTTWKIPKGYAEWKSSLGTFRCDHDLFNMYMEENVRLIVGLNRITRFKTFRELFNHAIENVKSDLDLLYRLCATGTHHNGRDLNWLENEGLQVELSKEIEMVSL